MMLLKIQNSTTSDEETDEDLMLAIAAGDRESFKILAERYMKLLYSVAFRMFPQQADAEDIVQEALLRLWNKAHLWKDNSGAAVSTWLYKMIYHVCIDQKRKIKYISTPLDENQPDHNQSADQKMQEAQRSKIIKEAIMKLPERQRMALIFCHYQGLSNTQAADIMETSVKGVEGLLVRARKTLQNDLKKFKEVL